ERCTRAGDGFVAGTAGSTGQVLQLAARADVAIVQGNVLDRHPGLADSELPLVVDLYDPFLFEQLEQTRGIEPATRRAIVGNARRTAIDSLARGDVFLCASTKQRDLWIGHLAALGRVNPLTYDADPTLHGLVRVVPFGIPAEPPVQHRHPIKGGLPGIGADDLVVLWGGGVYDWLDPVTVVEAVDLLRQRVPTVRLVFLGMNHPHPDVTEMAVARQTRQLARDRGLHDRHVFFVEGWVPYEERADWLLDADVAVSAHRDHLETAYAFRTRLLDCLWTGLPIVASTGDSFAELIDRHGLGRTVAPGDRAAMAAALEELLVDAEARRQAQAALGEIAASYTWPAVLEPLRAFCRDPEPAADRADPQLRRGLRAVRRAVAPRSRLTREVETLRGHLEHGGLPLAARKLAARLRRAGTRRADTRRAGTRRDGARPPYGP
ncbi:MAG TPA: glycosyltransferase, partial [Mycobacteriales bacterium]|nr:glycosyltransferase [Mycobacteriales bacterium]